MLTKIKKEINLIYKQINELFTNMKKDHVSEFSAQCAYYTILSFIPFLIVLITLVQYTRITPQDIYNLILKIVPEGMNETIVSIVQEIYSKSFGTLSISLLFILLSAGKGIYVLSNGLKLIYGIKEKRKNNYIISRLKSIFQILIFILFITITLIIIIFEKRFFIVIDNYLNLSLNLNNFNIVEIIVGIAFLLTSFTFFIGMYKFLISKVTIKSQIYGALFDTIAFNLISAIFSKYLEVFRNFSIIYGSLTTLILIMMWIYSVFFIIFLGAEFNKKINEKS